ncbi:MAG: type II toxin-antitoxin system PemK/MazF family toxin [Bryobacteraceae bacterium]
MWFVGRHPPAGNEQKARRPVLIVSPELFNRVTKVPVVLPITSVGSFARRAGLAVPLTDARTKTSGVVRCDQPRALDLGARSGKKRENVSDATMDEVLSRLATIFEGNRLTDNQFPPILPA